MERAIGGIDEDLVGASLEFQKRKIAAHLEAHRGRMSPNSKLAQKVYLPPPQRVATKGTAGRSLRRNSSSPGLEADLKK